MAGNANHSTIAGPAERTGVMPNPVLAEFESYHQPGQRAIDESHIRALAEGTLRFMDVDGKVKAAETYFAPSMTRLEEGEIVGGAMTFKAAKVYVRYMDRRDNRLAYEAADLERRRAEINARIKPTDVGRLALAG